MKNKYWVIALGLLVVLLTLVSACGSPQSTTTPTGTTPAATTPAATGTSTPTSTATGTPTSTATATSTPTATATSTPTQTSTGTNLSGILGLGANIEHVRYDMITTNPITGTVFMTIWEKGGKFREEMTMEGMTSIIIMDMDAGVYYMSSGENMWMAMTLDTSIIPEGAAENPNDILDYNPQITGTETIDGKSCTVITWEIPGTGTMTEWIWTEKGFPVKIETTTDQGTITIEFTNIDFSDIDDSMFELPEGAIVTTIGS